jgi:ankyrin repeat protein
MWAHFGAGMGVGGGKHSGSNGRARRAVGHSARYRLNRALVDAVADGEVEAARRLIVRGANVNFRNRQGETPLSFAAAWNQLEALKLLLSHGADPNVADRSGGTALMLAAQHGSAKIVRALLGSKADPRLTDSAGRNALDHADWRVPGDHERDEIRRLIERSVGNSPRVAS